MIQNGISRSLGQLYSAGTLNGLSESEWIDRFVASRDESAFEAIVERHGPMVLRVCQNVLGDRHEAEDAFQATFLVLARRASSIRNPGLLGPWLHRVARRIALRARSAMDKRLRRERSESDQSKANTASTNSFSDPDRWLLIEEVDRLPERYRRVVMLCDLQGQSHAEAARRLGCPIGTVKGQQARARNLLRRRLIHRGFASCATLGFSINSDAAFVSPKLLLGTARAASGIVGGGTLAQGILPTSVFSLTQGILPMMFWSHLKPAAVVALIVGVVGLGVYSSSNGSPFGARYGDQGEAKVNPTASVWGGDNNPEATGRPRGQDLEAVDDQVRPYLGTWEYLSTNGEPAPTGYSRRMELRRARQNFAEEIGAIGVALVATFTTNNTAHDELVILNSDNTPDQFIFLPLNQLTSNNDPINHGFGGSSKIEGYLLTLHLQMNAPYPNHFDPASFIPGSTVIHHYRRVDPESNQPPVPIEEETKPEPDEASKLVGRWKLISHQNEPVIETEGTKFLEIARLQGGLPENPDSETLWLATQMFSGLRGSQSRPTLGIFVFTPTTDPPQVDLRFGSNLDSIVTFPGIYSLMDDLLTIHTSSEKGGPRPLNMDWTPESASSLLVYQRVNLEDPSAVESTQGNFFAEAPDDVVQVDADDPLVKSLLGAWKRVSSNRGATSGVTRLEIKVDDNPRPESAGAIIGLDMKWSHISEPGALSRTAAAMYDPSQSPASINIDFSRSQPDYKSGSPFGRLGIIRAEGDVLTLCWRSGGGGTPPHSFQGDPTEGIMLEVYIRDRSFDRGAANQFEEFTPDVLPPRIETTAADSDRREDEQQEYDFLERWTEKDAVRRLNQRWETLDQGLSDARNRATTSEIRLEFMKGEHREIRERLWAIERQREKGELLTKQQQENLTILKTKVAELEERLIQASSEQVTRESEIRAFEREQRLIDRDLEQLGVQSEARLDRIEDQLRDFDTKLDCLFNNEDKR